MACYPVYLDYNATTPLEPSVIQEITKTLQNSWGNPSSNYSLGLKARDVVESSRGYIAEMINADLTDIIFTSGGTEVRCLKNDINVQYTMMEKVYFYANMTGKQFGYSLSIIDMCRCKKN